MNAMLRVTSVRFFLVVSPAPGWMRVAFAAAFLIGATTLWLNPTDVDSAFGSILLLQMFSASSGYTAWAGSGHFDPLLVSGRWRPGLAMSHLLAAALPGLLAWLAIAILATGLGRAHTGFSVHRQMALLVVSTGAWAMGLALPRLAAGALWSMGLLTMALSHWVGAYLTVVQIAPNGVRQYLAAAAAFAACPYLLLGDFAASMDPIVLTLDGAVVLTLACAGARYVSRREYGLADLT